MSCSRNLIAAGLLLGLAQVPAIAAEPEVMSAAPLIEKKSDHEVVATVVRSTVSNRGDVEQSIVEYMQARAECVDCDLTRDTVRHIYYSGYRAKAGQWQGNDNVGLAMRSGSTAFGLWADTREVTSFSNEDVYFVPTGVANAGSAPPAATSVVPDSVNIDATAGNGATNSNTSPQPRGGTTVNSGFSTNISSDVVLDSAPSRSVAPVTARVDIGAGGGNAFKGAPVAGNAPNVTTAPISAGGTGNLGGNVGAGVGAGGRAGGASQSTRFDAQAANATSELAYKEYVGGLFMSQSF